MKLLWVELENFRCYKKATRIIIDDITAFIGRNDSGKSSIFDALNIFFGSTKIDEEDRCKYGDGSPRITCAFSGFPEEIVLDDQAKTSLKSEFLLDQNNNLVISKTYENSREKTCILAYHPTTENADKLHDMTIDQLKKLAITLNIPEDKYVFPSRRQTSLDSILRHNSRVHADTSSRLTYTGIRCRFHSSSFRICWAG